MQQSHDGRKPPLWTPSFTLLTISNFGLATAFFALMATMGAYAVSEFSASNTRAGLVNSVFILGAMVARIGAGRAIELKGFKPVMIGALILHLLAIASYIIAPNLMVVLVVRALHGLGFGFSQTAVGGTVMAHVPPERRGEGSGWYTTGMSIGSGIAPFFSLALYNSSWGQDGVFLVITAVAVMSLITALIGIRFVDKGAGIVLRETSGPSIHSTAARKIRPRPVSLDGFIDQRAFPIGTVVALSAFTFAATLTFLDGYAKTLSLSATAQWYFVVYSVVILMSRPMAGIIQDKLGDDIVMIPLIISLTAGMIVTAYATTGPMLLLGAALLGLGYGTIVSAGQAMAVHAVGATRAGLAVSSYFLLVDLGTGVAPVILGSLLDPLGYRAMFLVATSVAVIALIVYVLWVRKSTPELAVSDNG